MVERSILQRCREAAAGHEAQYGADSRCLHHDVVDELVRLQAIERDVSVLLRYGADIKSGPGYNGRYYDPVRNETVTLEDAINSRMEAGKRLLAAVKRG